MEKKTDEDRMNEPINLNLIIFYLGIGLMTTGFCILIYQIFHWLKFGNWLELPLAYVLYIFPKNFVSWVVEPNKWMGLNKIVQWILFEISIPMASFFLGVAIMIYGESLNVDEQNKKGG